MNQINTFNADLAASHDDYSAPGIQKQADAVTTNIDQSEHYLAPRARAFTWRTHCDVGDIASCEDYIPIYKGEDFHALWRKLSSTDDSVKSSGVCA